MSPALPVGHPSPPVVIAVHGPSGTGKTTLVEQVVADLAGRGLRVGAVKHSGHRHPLQPPQSDSGRFLLAGAVRAGWFTPAGTVIAEPRDRVNAELIYSNFSDCDIVVVEGWRKSGLPTLRLSRAGVGEDPDWPEPTLVIAWVADHPVETALPVLPLNARAVADFIAEWQA